ncbi:MAG: glycosyl transferase [Clostridia bacterium]|nr:glycosyl transferase [Clostridia bacterium]
MIPKVIHYCWFGGNPLPKSAQKCINSWKKYFPDYEIKEWNESNYDVNKIVYTKEAYAAKKYAFVSDYARFDIIYNQGGVYFDTDVEVIKSFDEILEKGAFMGCEIDGGEKNSINVAPGLGIAAEAGIEFYKDLLDAYKGFKFLNEDGTYNTTTIVKYTTDMLKKNGLQDIKGIQTVAGINIYPKEYFNPLDDVTGKVEKTENTHSIHWYSKTWLSKGEILRSKITKPFHRLFGNDCFRWLKR